MAMRIPGLYVSVSGDLSQLEQDLKDGAGKVAQYGDAMAQKFKDSTAGKIGEVGADIARAYGDGASKAATYLDRMAQDVEDFSRRHKVAIGTVAVALAGVYAYTHQDQIKGYWDAFKTGASEAYAKTTTAAKAATDSAVSYARGLADQAKDQFGKMETYAAQAASSIRAALDVNKLADAGFAYLEDKARRALYGIAQEAIATGAQLDALSHSTGLSVEELSRLQSVSGQTGVAMGTLTSAAQALDAATNGQAGSAKLARDQLTDLGISVKDAEGHYKSTDALLVEVAGKFRALSDSGTDAAKKGQIAANIFGQSSTELVALLNEGSSTLAARLGEAARAQTGYTGQMAEDMANLKKEMDALAAGEEEWVKRKAIILAEWSVALSKIAFGHADLMTRLVEQGKAAFQALGELAGYYWDRLKTFFGGGNPMQAVAESIAATGNTPAGTKAPPNPRDPSKYLPSSSSGKTSTDLDKYITDLKNATLSEQAGFLGDTFGAKDLTNLKNYEHELLELKKKLEDYHGDDKTALEEAGVYWAKYRKGVADAAVALEHARAYLKEFGQTQEELGQLTGDVETAISGKIIQLELDRQEKIKKIENDTLATKEQIAQASYNVNALYLQKEADEKLKALGDAATLDAGYWERRGDYLDTWLSKVKKYITDENDQEAYAARKRSELRKEEIDARIGYESSFLETLKDVLSSELGFYKDSLTQQHDAWVSASKDFASSIKDFSSTAATGITGLLGGWVTGTGKMQDAFKSAMDGMYSYLMSIIQKMIKYALENYVTIPIIESLVGSSGSGSIFGKSSGSDSTGLLSKAVSGVSDFFTGGSSAADAALTSGMLSSSSEGLASVGSLASEGTLGLMETADVSTLGTSFAGLTSATEGAVAATEASTAAATGLGVSLGTVATGIGALVGVGALLISGFSETKTSTKIGSGYSMSVSGTNLSATGEDYYKNTTSSMFGGSSTTHTIQNTGALDSATLSALQSEWAPYASTVTGGFKTLGIGANLSGFQFPSWDVTEEQKGDYYRNVSNALTMYGLKQQGLQTAFDKLAKSGEAAVDTLARLSTAFASANEAGKQVGVSLETLAGPAYIGAMIDKMTATGDSASTASMDFSSLSGVMDDETLQSLKDMQAQAAATGDEVQATNEQLKQLALAQYASELVDAFGSTDNVTAAYSRYFSNAYSATEQADRLLKYYGTYAGEYIGYLGDSTVNLQNFWSRYRQAMEGGSLSASQVKAWDDAAQYVQAYDTELKAAGSTWVSTNKDLIDGIKDQISALQDQADVVQAVLELWSGFLNSIKDLRQAIAWDSNLTNLNKKQILDQMATAFTATSAKAKTGDAAAIAELPDLTKEYLAAAKDYYGASAEYFATFDQADATLADLQATAQQQTDLAQSQLDALNNEIAVLTLQVDQLSLVNTNLGTLANAVGDGVTAIVSAIGDSTYSSGFAASIAAANAAQQASMVAALAAASYSGPTDTAATPGALTSWSFGSDMYTPGSDVTNNGDGTYTIPGFASGGDFGPGLTMVGENGPELVRFNRPGSVANSRETASLMSNKGVEDRLEGIFNILADPNRSTKTEDAMLAELSALRVRMAKLEQRLQG